MAKHPFTHLAYTQESTIRNSTQSYVKNDEWLSDLS